MDSSTSASDRHVGGSTLFDFTLLFRAVGIALWHPTRMLLALVGVMASVLLGFGLDAVWPADASPVSVRMAGDRWVSESELYLVSADVGIVRTRLSEAVAADFETRRVGAFSLLFTRLRVCEDRCIAAVFGLDVPEMLTAARELLLTIAWVVSMHSVFAILFGLGLAAIWGFVGVGIARGVALAVAGNDGPTTREYVDTCRTQWMQAATIPLLPVVVMLAAAIALWLLGLVGAIPGIGALLVGVLFPLVIIGGAIIAFAMIFGAASLPLAPYGIVANGADATDAILNAADFVFRRPVKTLLYYFVAFVVGIVAFAAIKWLVSMSLWCGGGALGMTMNTGDASVAAEAADSNAMGDLDAVWIPPSLTGRSPFYGTITPFDLSGASWASRGLIRLWLMFVWALLAAFAVSYFYASAGIAWFLLRREVDLTDITEVVAEIADKESGSSSAVS